jgi:hypothetical protein
MISHKKGENGYHIETYGIPPTTTAQARIYTKPSFILISHLLSSRG